MLSHPKFSRTEPYNSLPTLPPKPAVETLRTLKAAIGANRALAELRAIGQTIPNQAILLRAIVLQEAKLSSEIENIVTTNDQLYQAFSDDAKMFDPNTKEVLRYEDALWHGYNHLRGEGLLTGRFFTEIVRIIRQTDIDIRERPGTQIANDRSGEVIYTPPVGEELIRKLLDNLSEYIYAEDGVDPLIKLAVLHYQFEAIHPFSDGNGRTGRVLNILYLLQQRLLDIPVLYLSQYIIQHKSRYYNGLRQVTEDAAWEAWILYILDAIESTATSTRERIMAIREALDEAILRARDRMSKGYSKELVELVFQQPYTRITTLARAGIAKRQSASVYLKELERVGILRGHKVGREVLYLNERLLNILAA